MNSSHGRAYEFYPQTNIPGYAGYIPRRIFDCGQSFARAASPTVRANVVNNMKERHYRKGPAWMNDTRAYETSAATREPEQRAPRSAVQDGLTHIPRYMSTFEKPGYAGHIPMELQHGQEYEQQVTVARDIPGYTGNIPNKVNKFGRPIGMVGRSRPVYTPEVVGGTQQRLLFSSHGGFARGVANRPPTGAAAAPFATDHNSGPQIGSQIEIIDRPCTGNRPQTGYNDAPMISP